MNTVVARFVDGRIIKGTTDNFFPNKDAFYVRDSDAPADEKPMEIRTSDLKALFFVKDLSGDPARVERKELDPGRPPVGRPIQVTFKDGEILVGTTTGYQPGRPGFFVEPIDPDSNNERCFVVAAATRDVRFI